MTGDIFDQFAAAMRVKFYASLQKDNRSPKPWEDYDVEFLENRFLEEWEEYLQANDYLDRAGELIDVAEFAMFLWAKAIDIEFDGIHICNHRIADARNDLVESGYMCIDCGGIFEASDHPPRRKESFNHGVGKDLRRNVVVDMDGVLVDFRNCTQECSYEGYPDTFKDLRRDHCPLMEGAVEAMNELLKTGHRIIIFTGRCEEERDRTEQWLDKHGIPYHELIMDKPRGFIYIDDLAHRFNGWDNTMIAVRNGARKIKDATLLSSGAGEQ